MVCIPRQSNLGLLYTWTIILVGFAWLWFTFPGLNFDQSGVLITLVVMGLLAEWLAVPFPRGYISGGYVIVLAAQLICGGVATAFVSGIVSLVGLGIANRGNPIRVTLFNSAQHVLAVAGAAFVFELLSGGLVGTILFTVTHFIINNILVSLYLIAGGQREHTGILDKDTLYWDSFTYLLLAPYGALMANVFQKMGIGWAVVMFLPVIAIQVILRRYVQLEFSNRKLTTLFAVAKRLRQNNQLEGFLKHFLQEIRRVVDYNTGGIFFWSKERQVFLPGCVQGDFKEELSNTALTLRDQYVAQAAQTKEAVIIYDSRDIALSDESNIIQMFRSAMILPLLTQGEVAGILILGSHRPYVFEERHIKILSALGSQAGIILTNDLLVEKIRQMQATDRLTEYLHHKQFYQQTVREMRRIESEGMPVSLLLVDIDNLRNINSRYGHSVGDAVLQMVAAVLRDVSRPVDIIGRYGGGELAVLAPDTDTAAAIKLAEQIRIEVRDRRIVPEDSKHQILVTVSIGLATFPQDATNPDQIFFGAEKAVARSKELGRDRTIAFRQLIKVKGNVDGDKNAVNK